MTATLTIRAATESDIPAIWGVHSSAISGTCQTHYSDEVIRAWVERLKPESYRAVVKRAMVLLAEDADRPVGFGQIDLAKAEIQAVYVEPAAQSRGVGATLLKALEEVAVQHRLPRITLKATLNAEQFYAARGWRTTAHEVNKITEQIGVECVEMEKVL